MGALKIFAVIMGLCLSGVWLVFFAINQLTTTVIEPTFTYSAYMPNGFYYHYNGKCKDCLTVPIASPMDNYNLTAKYSGNFNAVLILKLMGYNVVTDEQLALNEKPLSGWVYVLHSEYVTQSEYDAITSYPHVVYLYPNALYAKVSMHCGLCMETGHWHITLVGDIAHKHNYFNWTGENSQWEKTQCNGDYSFVGVANGYESTCWEQDPLGIIGQILFVDHDITKRFTS